MNIGPPPAGPTPAPQSKLSIQHNAQAFQGLCVPSNTEGKLAIVSKEGAVMEIPVAWLPSLQPNEPVLIGLTLTRVAVKPVLEGLVGFKPPKLVV